MDPNGVNLGYFKLRLFDETETIISILKGLHNFGFKKSAFVERTQFVNYKIRKFHKQLSIRQGKHESYK